MCARTRRCALRSSRRCARRRLWRPRRCGPLHPSGRRQVHLRSSKKPVAGALDAGLRLVAQRSHSRFELRRKLGRRGYAEAEVDAAVARLVELRYLDDRLFAEGHVRRRSATRGPLALSAELAARGIDRSLTDGAVQGFDPEAQLAAATRLVERLAGRKSFAGYRELLDSAGAKVLRRGFSPGTVRTACRAVWERTTTTREA
ncbi:MAG: recombination regulator RecX [Chloroflexi bacterium]|nr:MAG: recombination regulator RecX [Chloroflexota bacterium]